MNFIHRVIQIRNKGIDIGRRRQRKEDGKVMLAMQKRHAADIVNTIAREKARYEALLEERNLEIARLHEEIDGHRRAVMEIRNFSIRLHDGTAEIAEKFRQGFEHVARGVQLLNSARDKSEQQERSLGKRTPGLLKVLK